jgi:GNAT superfamily N-acetyltransferase
VSFANVFTRTIRVDEVEIAMGALNGVMTPRRHQRKGYGTATVREARRVIFEELSADIGFLLCLPKLVKFYEKRGWRVVHCPVWISQTAGPTRWPYKSMVLVNDYGLKQPHSIDLCGPPF